MARYALFGLLAACAGDKDPTGTGRTGDTAAVTPGPPTFTRVKAEVLPSCALSGCHASASSDSGLVLPPDQEGDWYAALVNAPSEFAPGQVLVIPSDPDGSYVIQKIEGSPGIVGDAMPPPFGNLDPRLYELLRDWIESGALDN